MGFAYQAMPSFLYQAFPYTSPHAAQTTPKAYRSCTAMYKMFSPKIPFGVILPHFSLAFSLTCVTLPAEMLAKPGDLSEVSPIGGKHREVLKW
jgi:hypothetical protein